MSSLMRSKAAPLVIVGVVVVVALAGGWLLGVAPKRQKAAELATEITSAEQQLAQQRADLAQPRADVNIRVGDIYRLAKALPDSPQMPGVLLDISRLAGRNGLEVTSVTPAVPSTGSGYLTHPMTVVVQGRYAGVSSFLDDVTGLVRVRDKALDARGRLYSVSSLVLGPPDGEGTEFPAVQATLKLDTFTFVETTPAITPTPSPAPGSSGAVSAAGATP